MSKPANQTVQTTTITPAAEKPEVIRDVANLYTFSGENLKSAGDVTVREAIAYGVSLVNKGEEMKARGVFVLASKCKGLDGDDLKAFREALKAELVLTAKEKAIRLLPADTSEKAREKAKADAVSEAEKRFDNLGQTIRAAQWVLENPKKVADSVSVFTVQQALAYVEPPTAKAGVKIDPVKAECHATVAKLLAKPGTSQTAIKKAVAAVKEKAEKAKAEAAKDTRTDEKKAEDAKVATIARLAERTLAIVEEIDKLPAMGCKPEDWRSAKLTAAVKSLAALAGVEVKA